MKRQVIKIQSLLLAALMCTAQARDVIPSNPKTTLTPPPVISIAETTEKKSFDKNKFIRNLSQTSAVKTQFMVYRCKHIRSKDLSNIIESFLTPHGIVDSGKESDVLFIADIPSNLPRLKRIIEEADRRVPQVLVEAQIVELILDKDFEKDVTAALKNIEIGSGKFELLKSFITNLATPGANTRPTQGGSFHFKPYIRGVLGDDNKNELTSIIRILETRGRAKILSTPSLILRRGIPGSLITGQEVPVLQQNVSGGALSTTTEYKEVGVKLNVTPIMVADGTVRLSVTPEASSVVDYTDASNGGVSNPIIAVRNVKTELELKNGEMAAIGGLLSTVEQETVHRVPLLGDIPGLRTIFSSKRKRTVKTQLVIFLTTTILDEGREGGMIYPKSKPAPARFLGEGRAHMDERHSGAIRLEKNIENIMRRIRMKGSNKVPQANNTTLMPELEVGGGVSNSPEK